MSRLSSAAYLSVNVVGGRSNPTRTGGQNRRIRVFSLLFSFPAPSVFLFSDRRAATRNIHPGEWTCKNSAERHRVWRFVCNLNIHEKWAMKFHNCSRLFIKIGMRKPTNSTKRLQRFNLSFKITKPQWNVADFYVFATVQKCLKVRRGFEK